MQTNFFENGVFSQKAFDDFLLSLKNDSKIAWTKNIVCTSLPVLAIDSKTVDSVVGSIDKQYYKEFLDNCEFNYYEATLIYAGVIKKLKTFDEIASYLDKYSNIVECWASVDCLAFSLKGEDKKRLFDKAVKYTQDKKPFVRRTGFRLMFRYIDDEYIDRIFDCIKDSKNEDEYYVNMIVAWLMCECFIKMRDKTLAFVTKAAFNDFTFSKFVSKCRDSYRVEESDKLMLKNMLKK